MTLFQLKAIKAQKMNIPQVRLKLLNALRKEGKIVEKEYQRTITTWKGAKPKFISLIGLERGDGHASVLTGPSGSTLGVQKWVWLDEGTKAHIIKARNRPRLVFRQGGFRAKTSIGNLDSSGGAAATGPKRFAKQVNHPGIKARGWTKLLQKRREHPFRDAMIKAVKAGTDGIYR